MLLRNIINGLFVFILLAPVSVIADSEKHSEDSSNLTEKASECLVCHGEDGNSVNEMWPSIAGQHKSYLLKQLHDFAKGEKGKRHNAVMLTSVEKLSDEDLEDLAEYYSKMKAKVKPLVNKYLELGEKIYRGGNLESGVPACSACHAPTGTGNSLANFPKVSGQNAAYIIEQMKLFKTGERSNDYNEIMQDIANKMTDKEIEAVANYMAAIH